MSTKYKILCWASVTVNSLGCAVNIYNVTQGYWYCVPMAAVTGFFALSSLLPLFDREDPAEIDDNPDEN